LQSYFSAKPILANFRIRRSKDIQRTFECPKNISYIQDVSRIKCAGGQPMSSRVRYVSERDLDI